MQPGENEDDVAALDSGVVWKLSSPIMAMGESVTELRLRRPTGMDVLMVGNPVIMDASAEEPMSTVRFDWPILGKMVSRLANVPLSTIGHMTPNELAALAWRLVPFFLPLA